MSEPGRLAGKRALVTGGGRGIGAAIARRLAADGAAVAVNYVADAASAEALVDELTAAGHRAAAFRADVADPEQMHDLVGRVVAEFGGLDLLASNAGVEFFGALESITAADFDRVFRINVAGQLFATQAAAAAMTTGGRILLTSSVSARIAVYHHTLYAASKAAVSAMVLNLAPELADRGIAINAIAPGGTATDMAAEHAPSYTPPALRGVAPEKILKSVYALGRRAEPAEIAAIAAFLLSSDASYMTGATIDASGGRM
jgi:NAD(P)-dependent dehydrogenase (short-subunit alcohol dehydrogenase family)